MYVASFTTRPLYPEERPSPETVTRKLDLTQNLQGGFVEEKNLCLC